MENGDKPISPTGHNQTGIGLTKREYFAGLAMQAIISSYDNDSRPHIYMRDEQESQISTCIDWADELLKQLEQ